MDIYIYVRIHSSYDIYDACKLGNIVIFPEIDAIYATGEMKGGDREAVFEVPNAQTNIIERLSQSEFYNLNTKYNAGTEFK